RLVVSLTLAPSLTLALSRAARLLAAPTLAARRLKCLLHLILHLPSQWLKRLVDLALDLVSGQLQRLLHLLAHGLGDLALQLAEDGLNGLTDLLLECLTEILVYRRGLAALGLVGRTTTAFRPLLLPRPPVLRSVVGLSLTFVPL